MNDKIQWIKSSRSPRAFRSVFSDLSTLTAKQAPREEPKYTSKMQPVNYDEPDDEISSLISAKSADNNGSLFQHSYRYYLFNDQEGTPVEPDKVELSFQVTVSQRSSCLTFRHHPTPRSTTKYSY